MIQLGLSITDYPDVSTWYYVTATDNIGCQGVDSIYVVVGSWFLMMQFLRMEME